MRPPGAAENVQDRERDRDGDPLEHAEERDAEERGDGQQKLDPPLAPEPHRPRDVGQRQRGGDHDRGQRGLRQVLAAARERARASARSRPPRPGPSAASWRPPARRPPSATRSCSPGSPGTARRRRWPRRSRSSPRCRRPPVPYARRTPKLSRSCRSARRATMPSAPATRSGRSETAVGNGERGNAVGSVPTTDTPWSARSKTRPQQRSRARRPPARPGPSAATRPSARISAQAEQPDRHGGAHRLAGGQPVDERLRARGSGRRRRPRTRTASAAGRSGSSVQGRSCSRSAWAWRAGRRRTRASPTPAASMNAPTSSASIEASAIGALGAAARADDREERRRDHRPKRRVGAQDQDPRRPEEGVAEQAEDRRVQAGDRRAAPPARRTPFPGARAASSGRRPATMSWRNHEAR